MSLALWVFGKAPDFRYIQLSCIYKTECNTLVSVHLERQDEAYTSVMVSVIRLIQLKVCFNCITSTKTIPFRLSQLALRSL